MIPKVILLGGAPRSGKSTLARSLSAELGHDFVATDDLGAAVRATAIDGGSQPDYREQYVRQTPQALWARALDGHRRLWPSVRSVISERLGWGRPAIVEGWAILPEQAASMREWRAFAVWLVAPQSVVESRVRADADFYVGASDPDLMIKNFVARGELYNQHVCQTALPTQLIAVHSQGEPLQQTVRRVLHLIEAGGGA